MEYTYDEQNRKTKHIQHQGGLPDITTQYTSYDNNGNLKELIDPNGRHISYDYDTLNRQTDAHYASVGSPYYETTHIHTEYDKNNNVTRITETKTGAAGSLTDITDNSEYDQFDRLKTTTERGKTIHYDYDVNGNRTLVSSDAGSTTYSYDARNRLEWADQNTSKTFYTYYPDDRPDTVTFPNGTETVYTYYPETNRVKTITNTVVLANSVISSFDYTYDSNGNRTKQIEVQNGVSETTDYSFDTMDRLTGYTLSGADTLITGYTFEGYNRKSETVIKNALITTSREYTYNDLNRLTKIDDTTDSANPFTIDYAYDNNGNTIHKSDSSLTNQDITYTYDSRNQLVQVTRGPPASPELLGQYDYNADGLRVRHKNSERGNVNYYYDGNSVLEERSADTDTLLAHYRYADRLLSLDTGAEVQYYLNDALGSTVNLTTDVGSVKVSYWLDPYGEIRKQEGSSVNRMVFTGQEHDEKTGLVYFGARYYDEEIERFVTQDSYLGEIKEPLSLHRYLYCRSNPVSYIDEYGFEWSYAYHWHHTRPQEIFKGSGDNAPFIKELGLKLSENVDISASEHGRIMQGYEHLGSKKLDVKGVHAEYNAWWKQELQKFKRKNPEVKTITDAHIKDIESKMPEKFKEFNNRGQKSNISYSEWKNAKQKLETNKLVGERIKVQNASKITSGIKSENNLEIKNNSGNKKTGKLRKIGGTLNCIVGPLQFLSEGFSLYVDQNQADRLREAVVEQYKVRGYSNEQIQERLKLRYEIEYRATETYPVLGAPNPSYIKNDGKKYEKFLQNIPEDVIVPEKDVEKIKYFLTHESKSS